MNNLNISTVRGLKILSFFFIIIFVDQFTGRLLSYLYFNQKAGQDKIINYGFAECKADVLILGSSRAQHHYDTQILSHHLQMSCYNLGINGQSILMPYAQIKIILNRYSPKIILFELDPNRVYFNQSDYDKLSILLPYYNKYPEIRPIIQLKSSYEQVKLLSSIYPFNSSIMNILRFNTNIDINRKWDINGYVPIKNQTLNTSMLKIYKAPDNQTEIDTNMLNSLKDIIHICNRKRVALFFVCSPVFHSNREKKSDYSHSSKRTIELLKQENANFLDFSNDTSFINNAVFFSDKEHLNSKGADRFSNILGEYLKNLSKESYN